MKAKVWLPTIPPWSDRDAGGPQEPRQKRCSGIADLEASNIRGVGVAVYRLRTAEPCLAFSERVTGRNLRVVRSTREREHVKSLRAHDQSSALDFLGRCLQ